MKLGQSTKEKLTRKELVTEWARLHLLMVPTMKVSGITVREKATERLGTQMAPSTRANGEVIKEMDKDSFSTLTEMLCLAYLRQIRDMEMVSWLRNLE